ncbi:MAG: SIMPL domain-containing protein [Pseudomonadota bacterium]
MAERGLAIVVSAAVLAVGGVMSSQLIGDAARDARQPTRQVTVRGAAERAVEADVGVWRFSIRVVAPDLTAAQAEIDADVAEVRAFFAGTMIGADAVELGNLSVQDALASFYRPDNYDPSARFILDQTVVIRSSEVGALEDAVRQQGVLLRRGVALANGGVRYVFSGLNEVKPELVTEATASARNSAAQFAADSGASVGSIIRANQGYVSIQPQAGYEDVGEPGSRFKKVRVVVTIDYALEG